MPVIVSRTESVPISSVRTYDKNPRVGNVDLIAESLNTSGQFKPIVVNERTGMILAGNHTYLAARKLGWTDIYASFVDVDDATAKRIVLADNKTADAGEYDDSVLAELIASLPDISGTGYSAVEVDDIIKSLNAYGNPSLDDITSFMPDDISLITGDKTDNRQKIIEGRSEEDQEAKRGRGAANINLKDDKDIEDLEDTQTELQAILELRESTVYPFENFWGVPQLREDMLLDRLPEPLTTWGGIEATPDDGNQWYLYNYSLGGIKGLPFDRSILCFFTHDHKFDNWWQLPAYYTAKIISAGCRMAVCPDFSFYYTQPRAIHLQGVYQSQWLGRFFQEAGLKVIPRVQFDDEASLEFCMLGIPKNPPVLAVSVQNFGTEDKGKKEDEKQVLSILQKAIDKVEPTTQVLIYGGNPAKKIMDQLDLHGAEGVHVMNYAGVRRHLVYGASEGTGKLTATQKKKLKEKVKEQEAKRLGIDLSEKNLPDDEDY
jgi:hypothetical protein